MSLPSLQSTCFLVWWWCTSCSAPSTRWPTCTASRHSCSCRAVRNPTWMKKGSPSWTATRHRLTRKTKLPANPWTRDHRHPTAPSTRAKRCGGREQVEPLFNRWLRGWIYTLFFFPFLTCKTFWTESGWRNDELGWVFKIPPTWEDHLFLHIKDCPNFNVGTHTWPKMHKCFTSFTLVVTVVRLQHQDCTRGVRATNIRHVVIFKSLLPFTFLCSFELLVEN